MNKETKSKCCGKCLDYGIDGGNLCERYLICDNECTCISHPIELSWEERFENEFVKRPVNYRENHGWTVPYVDSRAEKLIAFIHSVEKAAEEKARSEIVKDMLKCVVDGHFEVFIRQFAKDNNVALQAK